jgi:hypothetical protein
VRGKEGVEGGCGCRRVSESFGNFSVIIVICFYRAPLVQRSWIGRDSIVLREIGNGRGADRTDL